jgi:hypothetical protein
MMTSYKYIVRDVQTDKVLRELDASICQDPRNVLNEGENEYVSICSDNPAWCLSVDPKHACTFYNGPAKEEWLHNTIHVVYFINTFLNKNFHVLLQAQMQDVWNSNMFQQMPNAILHIVSLGLPKNTFNVRKIVSKIFNTRDMEPRMHFTAHNENNHEYYGILKVWELARDASSDKDIIVYFHSKGITRSKLINVRQRDAVEVRLTSTIIVDWKVNLDILNRLDTADKLGASSGDGGWMWFNFWWAKTRYLKQLERPVETSRRYYYEDWLSRVLDPQSMSSTICPTEENTNEYTITVCRGVGRYAAPKYGIFHIGGMAGPTDSYDMIYDIKRLIASRNKHAQCPQEKKVDTV